jgi:hypothetical protein
MADPKTPASSIANATDECVRLRGKLYDCLRNADVSPSVASKLADTIEELIKEHVGLGFAMLWDKLNEK